MARYTYYIDRVRWEVAVLPTSELDSGEKALANGGYPTFEEAKRALLRELKRDLQTFETWADRQRELIAHAFLQRKAAG